MQSLQEFLLTVNEAAAAISHAAEIVDTVRDYPDLYNKYNVQLQDMIVQYNQQVELLRATIENYFKMEKEKGLPVNLSLRKAYASLKFL